MEAWRDRRGRLSWVDVLARSVGEGETGMALDLVKSWCEVRAERLPF